MTRLSVDAFFSQTKLLRAERRVWPFDRGDVLWFVVVLACCLGIAIGTGAGPLAVALALIAATVLSIMWYASKGTPDGFGYWYHDRGRIDFPAPMPDGQQLRQVDFIVNQDVGLVKHRYLLTRTEGTDVREPIHMEFRLDAVVHGSVIAALPLLRPPAKWHRPVIADILNHRSSDGWRVVDYHFERL